MKAIKTFIVLLLFFAALPMAFAGNIENNYIYAYGTNAPLSNTQGLLYRCTDTSCTNVQGSALFNGNSGSSNVLTMEYGGTSTTAYYGKYFFTPTYVPWGGVFWDWGDNGVYNYDVYMYRANDCHAPVDSFAITNTVYANEPLVINYPALVDSTVTSAFRRSSAPPYYTPSGYDDYFSALTDVVLEVYDPSGNLVHTETKQVNLFADSQEEVVFDWTPTTAGEGYTASVTTDVTDDQCASSITQSTSKGFNVLPARPQDECYTLLNNLDIDNEYPEMEIDNVTFSYEKISNYAAMDYSKTAIPTDVTYTIRQGRSDPSGAIAWSGSETLSASSTDSPTQYTFNWLPMVEGWYTVYVTGVGNSNMCDGKSNYDETLELEVYVNPHPMVNVFFEISDNDGGAPIQGASISFNGQLQTTDADGKASFSNVPGRTTYAYTVTHSDYNTISGSEYIPEVDRYIYLSMTELDNEGPQFTSTPVTSACIGQAYSYDADATDPEGDAVTYSLDANPTGMSIDSTSGVVSWTPTETGSNAVQIRAADTHGSSNIQLFVVSVEDCDVNTAPSITSQPAGGFVCLGDAYSYDVEYNDAEGDAAQFSLTTAPAGMSVDASTGVISWTADQTGHIPVTVRATDGRDPTLMDQQAYTVSVVDCSQPITATADDQTCLPGETIYMSGAVTGGLPPYDWAWDLDNDGTHEAAEFAPAFTCGNVVGTQYTVELLVTDSVAQEDTDAATITVVEYRGPTIVSEPVTVAYEDEQYEYDVEAIDPDNDPITYTLDQDSLDRGMTINPSNGRILYTPESSELGNSYTVTVTATSTDGSDSQTYTVTVSERPEGFGFYVNDLYVSAKIIGGEYVSPDDNMQLLFRLSNEGSEDFEGVQILTYVDSLAMRGVNGPFDLDDDEEVDKRVYMPVPVDAEEGVHYIRVIVSTDLGWREVYREFTVRE